MVQKEKYALFIFLHKNLHFLLYLYLTLKKLKIK